MRKPSLCLLLGLVLPAAAQNPLTLQEAVRTALSRHPSLDAVRAQGSAADTRREQARSGWLPKLNYSESFTTGNNPVYVFSSLLSQRRFTAANFDIYSLNRPEFTNNFQSQVVLDQPVYDGGQTKQSVASAELGKQMNAERERQTQMRLIAEVARNYHGVVLAEENRKVAEAALRSAEADLERAEAVRAAGMATDADVLSIKVHMAAMREQEIERRWTLEVAWAALNRSLGMPLETRYQLTTPLKAVDAPAAAVEDKEKSAVSQRPELRQASLAARLAESRLSVARSAYLPQVSVRGIFEVDRGKFVSQGGSNWFFGATLRWNLFNGFGDKERIREATFQLTGAKAQQRESDSAVRVEVRQAHAALQSARERLQVAEATVAQAEESLRITRNRYENGLNTVTDLLRTETALLETRTRRLAAIYDQRVAAAMLELSAGALTGDSYVLQ